MEQQTQQVEQPQLTASPKPISASRGFARCRSRKRNGGRCRLPVQDPASGLCFKHALTHEKGDTLQDSTDLSKEILVVNVGSYGATANINSILSNVVELIAKGRISPRRAAVITYALSLMLRSIIVADHKAANAQPQIIFDDPCARSDQDQPSADPQQQNNTTVADPYSRPHT